MNTINLVNAYLGGAVTLGSLAVAYFFLRFRKATGDRLFAFFAVAFLLLALERLCVEFAPEEFRSKLYLIRCVAFVLLLCGILDKNRKARNG